MTAFIWGRTTCRPKLRGWWWAERMVGVSTHNLEQVKEADAGPADYIAIGPVFPTTGKKNPGCGGGA